MFYLYFDVQIARHELGHSLGMGHTYTHAYPPGWDCGPSGAIMSGNDRTEWNPCGKMDFKRMYTQYSANWCLPSKQIVQNVVKRQKRESRNGILLTKLFCPTVKKHCSTNREKLLKFEAEGREFAKN